MQFQLQKDLPANTTKYTLVSNQANWGFQHCRQNTISKDSPYLLVLVVRMGYIVGIHSLELALSENLLLLKSDKAMPAAFPSAAASFLGF
jgi:hypothetical protein